MGVSWWVGLIGFGAGLLIAMLTAPVGVSGAVFLLPIQLSVVQVPSPAVTPTNLLFNVVAGPGALLRYARSGRLPAPLTRRLIAGTVPGVILGAFTRVFLLPGATVFRLVAGCVLLPLGGWLCTRTLRRRPARPKPDLSGPAITGLALGIGVIGGIYGIGGGSILGPILVGRGQPVSVAPYWGLGLLAGAGGLIGGYLGARLQPHLPETALRLLLGATAVSVGALYLVEALA